MGAPSDRAEALDCGETADNSLRPQGLSLRTCASAGAILPVAVPITYIGPLCARRGCRRPAYRNDLCGQCWRLARMFGKDVELFAYKPLDGYGDDRDAVELPWERWEQEASGRGGGVADLFAEAPPPDRSQGQRPER